MANETPTPENPKVVNLNTRIEVTATDKHPFATKGEKILIHPTLAESLAKKGFVTTK